MPDESVTEEQPKIRLFGGIRWGLGLPTVILVGEYALPPRDHLHIVREFYGEEALLDDVIQTAKEWKEDLKIWKWYTREPEFMEELKKQRLRVQEIPDQTLLAIQLIRKRLGNQSQGLPGGLTVSRECRFTVDEFNKFRRPERDHRKPYRDKPLDVDNYAMGALHYLVLGLSLEKRPRARWL